MNLKRKLAATALFLGLLAITPLASQAAPSSQDAAKDDRGNYVTSTNGNCVRTRWTKDSDPCAPAAPPPAVVEVPAPAPQPSLAALLKDEQRTVYFDFNKSELKPEEKAKLDSLADVLKSDKNVKSASIVGFADRIGSDEYNDKLSQKRAVTVQDFLTSQGYINTTVAKTQWVGEKQPTTSCSEKAKRKEQISCLAADRKVEVQIEFVTVQAPSSSSTSTTTIPVSPGVGN